MTIIRAPWLADVLRAEGLEVVEHPGWKTRGRDFADLAAIVWHHDASAIGDSPGVPAYMLREIAAGRAGAQLWVDRAGTWHVLAAGLVFHAGRVRKGKPSNSYALGVETDHTTGEDWPLPQLYSLRRGTAGILRRLGWPPSTGLEFHRTICSPIGRKSDPAGLDLDDERVLVAGLMQTKPALTITPEEDDMAGLLFIAIDDTSKKPYLVCETASAATSTKRWLTTNALRMHVRIKTPVARGPEVTAALNAYKEIK